MCPMTKRVKGRNKNNALFALDRKPNIKGVEKWLDDQAQNSLEANWRANDMQPGRYRGRGWASDD
jgi:hypothetical protein